MRELAGRVAVITGAASGLGEGIAHACQQAGMRLALADIDGERLEQAASALRAAGAEVVAVPTDVSDAPSFEELAARAYEAFGEVNVLFNNAGVMRVGSIVESTDSDWRWLFDVNLLGPVHGIQAFLPRMREQDGDAHIVNTASMAGIVALPTSPSNAAYCASKFAVVGLSEVLREEVAPDGIGVSVVCAGPVQTRIFQSERNRPEQYGGPEQSGVEALHGDERMDPRECGQRILRGLQSGHFYIFTHQQRHRERIEQRSRDMLGDFDGLD